MLIPATVISFLAPKILSFFMQGIASSKHLIFHEVGDSLIKAGTDEYAKNKIFIERWIKDVVPGDMFDQIVVVIVEKIVEFAIIEIKKFVEEEVDKHDNPNKAEAAKEVIAKLADMSETPEVVDKLAHSVVKDTMQELTKQGANKEVITL